MNPTILPDTFLSCIDAKDRLPMGKSGLTAGECDEKFLRKRERDLRNQVIGYLRIREIEFCTARTDKRSRMTVGWPDITCAIGGYPVAFELKSATGKLSPEQELCHAKMLKNGWNVFVQPTV